MRKVIALFLCIGLRCALWFRYRITFKGLDNLDKVRKRDGGIIFLPNHPAMVDPIILSIKLWGNFHLKPIAAEYIYNTPFAHFILKFIKALSIPNFEVSNNSFKLRRGEKTIQNIVDGLKVGDNFLIYPAGKLRLSAKETIGGASGVHNILQQAPDANIVLVRTTGLWGSSFSCTFTHKPPNFIKKALNAIKVIFKNLIFFVPKRKIVVEFALPPKDFPKKGSRKDLNRYLENWYNEPFKGGEEPISLVPYSIWSKKLPKITKVKEEQKYNLKDVPSNVHKIILGEIARLANVNTSKISVEMNLSANLGLDSLDIAALASFIDHRYDKPGLVPTDLTSVKSAMIATVIPKDLPLESYKKITKKWANEKNRPQPFATSQETLPAAFLERCDVMGSSIACGDHISGVFSYNSIKFRVLLLADYIKKLPGDRIGILLPSTVASYVVILATLFARKTPVMLNWTVGPRHLAAVKKESGITTVLSSWNFLESLTNVDFGGIEEQIILLEDVRKKISFASKVKNLLLSYQSKEKLIPKLNLGEIKKENHAVLLFTSGTEGLPKGVPLTHHNILSNQNAAFKKIKFSKKDVLYSILPPFHAFGFTVTGLLPLLFGIKVAYYPNPTNSQALAHGIAKWGITIIFGTPAFAEGILEKATTQQLKTVKLFVVGAEKAPMRLFDKINKLNKKIMEGYGVTECSPVLTVNALGDYNCGVGKPLQGVEIKIIHQETHAPMSQGEIGLIIVRGPNIFDGYLNKDRKQPFVYFEDKMWYSTGDLGFLDPDGNLILAGRLKRFVKIGGEMISLPAIEETLINYFLEKTDEKLPFLALIPKEEEGEKTKLYLFSILETSTADVNDIIKNAGFSNLAKITDVISIPQIPLSGTGKIDYRSLDQS